MNFSHQWYVPEGDCDGSAVVFLPGRGASARSLMMQYEDYLDDEDQKILIAIDPENASWYPPPNGPNDQDSAVTGCEKTTKELNAYIGELLAKLHVQKENVVLVGFSAGGVMAIQLALHDKYAGAICHNGCVLEPGILDKKVHNPTIYLYHARDDGVFGWKERYLPTKKALIEKGYNVVCKEHNKGGHHIQHSDMQDALKALAKLLERK